MSVIWHDVECGSYAADLSLWEELAGQAEGPVLDLGCGSGRVALHLGRRGHRVLAVDRDPELVSALTERATELPIEAMVCDARQLELGNRFSLALAPMQLMQLLSGPQDRMECLRRVSDHLQPEGKAAMAIVEQMPDPEPGPPPLPDVAEIDGWIYSSLPIDTGLQDDAILVRRLRQTVSPEGELSDAIDEIRLRRLSAERLEAEAAEVGLKPAGRLAVPPTDAHVGSTVVVLGKEA
jgi:SAM-dependent methyltransferase